VTDRLTPTQQTALDEVPVEGRLRPSGDQTPAQARNFAVDSFIAFCDFEGIGTPSAQAVEAAVDAALAAGTAGPSVRPR
jgi:hypothetical protein